MKMMILNSVTCRAVAMAVPRRPLSRLMCCASTIDTQQLRFQIDQLHAEAETTRAKANNARMRLLRLSEAAEKLQKHAARSVQKGKEYDAREMLFQRKKVLQALEKSKSRIELLDELSTKLSEAISLKESQLIGNVAINIEDKTEDASNPVRIIAPREEVGEEFTEDDLDPKVMKFSDIQDVQLSMDSEGNPLVDKETEDLQSSLRIGTWNEENTAGSLMENEENTGSSLMEISSYEAFLEHIDQKLSELETELVSHLKVSTLIPDGEEKPRNSRLQQTIELLESIHGIRQRIRSTKEGKVRIF